MTPSPHALSLLFPGQGSQQVGMGQDLATAYPAAKAVFEEVDEALGEPLSRLIAEGPDGELMLTRNAQPALMAVSVAAWRVLEQEGFSLDMVRSVAGHSLGEYSAHCVAGAISLTDTARLLRLRGEAMQEAVPVGQGAMAAIIGLDEGTLELALMGTGAQVANDNAPGQIVISGSTGAVDAACAAAKAKGAKRTLPLPVSAPFHCSLMLPAQDRMAAALAGAGIGAPKVPVFANVTAGPVTDADDIRQTLTEQVTGRVRWTETVRAMTRDGTRTFLEVGSGKVLSGLVRRIAPDATALQFGAPGDLEAVRDHMSH